ncbi:MAG: thioredoxin domain-containing protein [Myxococcota bacterium]|nr:thioredoxin domain-containing protein [Myxococcota bacterium]
MGVFTACAAGDNEVTQCTPDQGYVLDNQHVPRYGLDTAPIDVSLFVDFECPHSGNMARRVFAFLNELQVDNKPGVVKVFVRHFPSPIHSRARAAAIAAAAALRQGDAAFFRFFAHLFKSNMDLTDRDILLYAELAALDMAQFEADLNLPEVAAVVDRDLALATTLGFGGTPGVVICGIPVESTPEDVVENLENLVDGVEVK